MGAYNRVSKGTDIKIKGLVYNAEQSLTNYIEGYSLDKKFPNPVSYDNYLILDRNIGNVGALTYSVECNNAEGKLESLSNNLINLNASLLSCSGVFNSFNKNDMLQKFNACKQFDVEAWKTKTNHLIGFIVADINAISNLKEMLSTHYNNCNNVLNDIKAFKKIHNERARVIGNMYQKQLEAFKSDYEPYNEIKFVTTSEGTGKQGSDKKKMVVIKKYKFSDGVTKTGSELDGYFPEWWNEHPYELGADIDVVGLVSS